MSKTSRIAVVVKSLIVKRKEGQVVAKGVTRKVIDLDDHTLRSRRVLACSSVMLYIRNEVGVQFFFAASSDGVGAATLISCAAMISAPAVRILALRDSCESGFLASGSKGIAISFPLGHASHSLMVEMWMFSKIEKGEASWIGGMGPKE